MINEILLETEVNEMQAPHVMLHDLKKKHLTWNQQIILPYTVCGIILPSSLAIGE